MSTEYKCTSSVGKIKAHEVLAQGDLKPRKQRGHLRLPFPGWVSECWQGCPYVGIRGLGPHSVRNQNHAVE